MIRPYGMAALLALLREYEFSTVVESEGAFVRRLLERGKAMGVFNAGVTAEHFQYQNVRCGELAGSATALQLPNVPCSLVRFKAVASNAGNVYLGGAGVTVVNGTTDVTTGLEIGPGEDTGWLPVDNLNRFYRICDNAGDDLTYLALV